MAYMCKWCGQEKSTVSALRNSPCNYNPIGDKHELYKGSKKSTYYCKYCGEDRSTIWALTGSRCNRSPHHWHEAEE